MTRDPRPSHNDPTLLGGRVTIDLGALASNWRMLAARAENAATAAVVKADAYGIGLEQAARALAEVGCQTFFVAVPEEGRRLRATVRDAIIYILDGLMPDGADALADARLRPVLGSWPEIEEWAAFRKTNKAAAGCAVHVDTGMNRLGVTPGEARKLAQQSGLLAALKPDLIMSHLATADTPGHPLNRKQLAAFRAVRVLLPDIPASLANSAGILLGPEYHFDLVRPGIALYGGTAVAGMPSSTRAVATVEARILQIRRAKPGDTVGYGATETVTRPSHIAILAAGYGDGYHRLAGSSDKRPGARVFLRGRHARLIGRVSMDLIAVDVTDIAGADRGDWVELMGPNVPVDEVAERAGTIGYELLTGIGRRYARSYIDA